MRFAVFVLIAAVVAAGCGASSNEVGSAPRIAVTQRTCEWEANGFRTCASFGDRQMHSTIERRSSSGWRVVTGPLPRRPGSAPFADGFWRYALVSPDGRTLLAQWSRECESPSAFFVPTGGGLPRAVTGERDWAKAPESSAIGWTSEGRARVLLHGPACGLGAQRPGVYLIDPERGSVTLERALLRRGES